MELIPGLPVLVAGAYLLGGIPTAYLMVRLVRGVDVRTVGSGNVGATNAARAGGLGIGIAVFVFDALKGMLPVWFAQRYFPMPGTVWAVPAAMLAVVAGHAFSVFLRFSGGKGVATAAGAIALAAPTTAAWCLGLFIVVVATTRYVSAGSILACTLFMILVLSGVAFPAYPLLARVLICGVPLLVIARHAGNIRRLIAGTEHRVGSRER